MSLRTFHIFFISLSVLMCMSSAIVIAVVASDESWAVPGMVASAVAAVGLIIYGRYFLQRYGKVLPKW